MSSYDELEKKFNKLKELYDKFIESFDAIIRGYNTKFLNFFSIIDQTVLGDTAFRSPNARTFDNVRTELRNHIIKTDLDIKLQIFLPKFFEDCKCEYLEIKNDDQIDVSYDYAYKVFDSAKNMTLNKYIRTQDDNQLFVLKNCIVEDKGTYLIKDVPGGTLAKKKFVVPGITDGNPIDDTYAVFNCHVAIYEKRQVFIK